MQGDRPITGNQLDNMKANSFPHPFLNYKAMGTRVKLSGKEKVGDRDAFVLMFEPTTGSAIKQFIDAETYLPVSTMVDRGPAADRQLSRPRILPTFATSTASRCRSKSSSRTRCKACHDDVHEGREQRRDRRQDVLEAVSRHPRGFAATHGIALSARRQRHCTTGLLELVRRAGPDHGLGRSAERRPGSRRCVGRRTAARPRPFPCAACERRRRHRWRICRAGAPPSTITTPTTSWCCGSSTICSINST